MFIRFLNWLAIVGNDLLGPSYMDAVWSIEQGYMAGDCDNKWDLHHFFLKSFYFCWLSTLDELLHLYPGRVCILHFPYLVEEKIERKHQSPTSRVQFRSWEPALQTERRGLKCRTGFLRIPYITKIMLTKSLFT